MLPFKRESYTRKQLTSRQMAKMVTSKESGHFDCVSELDLSFNKISSQKFLQHFISLTKLNLAYNEISRLQSFVPAKLLSLNLSYNKLNSLKSLSSLTSLTELDVSHNNLSSITGIGDCKHLRSLDVTGNSITELGGLAKLRKLKTLKVKKNRISQLGALHILSHNTALTHLEVSDNPVSKPGNYRISVFHMLPHVRMLDGSATPGIGARARAQITQSAKKPVVKQKKKRMANTPTARTIRRQLTSASSGTRTPVHSRPPIRAGGRKIVLMLSDDDNDATQQSLQLELQTLDEKLKQKSAGLSETQYSSYSRNQSPVSTHLHTMTNNTWAHTRHTPRYTPHRPHGQQGFEFSSPIPSTPEVNSREIHATGTEQPTPKVQSAIRNKALDLLTKIDEDLNSNANLSAGLQVGKNDFDGHSVANKNTREGCIPMSSGTLQELASRDLESFSARYHSPPPNKAEDLDSMTSKQGYDGSDDALMLGLACMLDGEKEPSSVQKLAMQKKQLVREMYKYMYEKESKKKEWGILSHAFCTWRNTFKAVKKTRLEERLRRRIRTTSTLWSIGLKLWHHAEEGQSLGTFLEESHKLASLLFEDQIFVDPAINKEIKLTMQPAVYLLDNSGGMLLIDQKGKTLGRFPVEYGIAGHVCSTGQPVVTESGTEHQYYHHAVDCSGDLSFLKNRTQILQPRILCLPILAPETKNSQPKALGAIQFYGLHPNPFDDEDMKMASAYTAQLAVALLVVKKMHLLNEGLSGALKKIKTCAKDTRKSFNSKLRENGAARISITLSIKRERLLRKCLGKLHHYSGAVKLKSGRVWKEKKLMDILKNKEHALRLIVARCFGHWKGISLVDEASITDLRRQLLELNEDKEVCVSMLLESKEARSKLETRVKALTLKLERFETDRKATESKRVTESSDRHKQIVSPMAAVASVDQSNAMLQQEVSNLQGLCRSTAFHAGVMGLCTFLQPHAQRQMRKAWQRWTNHAHAVGSNTRSPHSTSNHEPQSAEAVSPARTLKPRSGKTDIVRKGSAVTVDDIMSNLDNELKMAEDARSHLEIQSKNRFHH